MERYTIGRMTDINALQLQPGDMVGGYTLDSRLGSGAMGSVWKVVDGGGTAYAMKILRASLSDSEDGNRDSPEYRAQVVARERLRREAVAMRKIKNPGVVQIVDMEIDDSLAFLVTELIEGENLREDVRHNGKYVGDDLERLSSKLIDAVHAVHEAGIVHRDIKPTNVMISVTGPVLVDFGIAMAPGENHVTSTGLVMGTPGFIAPEIIEGAESTADSDWWSLASVLAFAATGEPVFGTSPMMAVLQREAAGHANLTGLPPHTMEAFRAALNPDPSQRCTPQGLLEAIRSDAWNGDGEAMLPFDAGDPGRVLRSRERVDNPRSLWRRQSMPTEALPVHASQATQPMLLDEPAATQAMPAQRAQLAQPAQQFASLSEPPAPPAQTTLLQQQEPATQAMQAMPAQETEATRPLTAGDSDANASFSDAQATRAMPAPTRVLATQPAAAEEPTQALPTNTFKPVEPAPAYQPPEGYNGEFADTQPPSNYQQYAQTPAFTPPQVAYQQAAQMHRSRAIVPILLTALPLMILAATCPIGAGITASVLIWVQTALGMNLNAHITHVLKRGGQDGTGSKVLRAAQLPWHMFAAIFMSIWSLLLFWVTYLILLAASTYLMGLPTFEQDLPFPAPFGRIPLLSDSPESVSGLWLAVALLLAWLFAQFGPYSANMRAGAGVIVGLSPKQKLELQPQGSSTNIRRFVVLGIWVIALVAAVLNLSITPTIDWWPITAWSPF